MSHARWSWRKRLQQAPASSEAAPESNGSIDGSVSRGLPCRAMQELGAGPAFEIGRVQDARTPAALWAAEPEPLSAELRRSLRQRHSETPTPPVDHSVFAQSLGVSAKQPQTPAMRLQVPQVDLDNLRRKALMRRPCHHQPR